MKKNKFWILLNLFGGILLFLVVSFCLSSDLTGIPVQAMAEIQQTADLPRVEPMAFDRVTEGNYNCRYGATVNDGSQTVYLDDLAVGWYSNFSVNFTNVVSSGIEYVPTIRLKQARDEVTGDRLPDYLVVGPQLTDEPDGLGALIDAHPGSLWLVGNEVDRIYWQDDIMPEVYAKAYHDVYYFIKERDPSAKVANSGLVQVTPGRLQYLDIMWDEYLALYGMAMPVDVWNMHVYILPEAKMENGVRQPSALADIALGTDINLGKLESDGTSNLCADDGVYCFAEHDDIGIFAGQVVAMRQWMKGHGQQQKPLIITEYSQLYPYIDDGSTCFLTDEFGNCFTESRVTQFMQETVNLLENSKDPNLGYHPDEDRLVQQWLWYTVNNSEEGAPSNLVYLNHEDHADGTLTPMGVAYQQAATSELYINLVPEVESNPFVAQNSNEITLTVSVMNNGSISVTDPFTVTFYEDELMTEEIGSYRVEETIGGCVRSSVEVAVNWDNLAPGLNEFWGMIDSDNDIDEDNTDNQFNGFVLVNPWQLVLPMIYR
ncbi:MAG: hypothetical protein CSA11_03870 [Chloroflexi bacterium]|nr:MAG: hypothetical protein CSA11_03870 [Chloroflexota bacterium]